MGKGMIKILPVSVVKPPQRGQHASSSSRKASTNLRILTAYTHDNRKHLASTSCLQHFADHVYEELNGNFSVSRLRSFHEYRSTTSVAWLVLVMVVTPLPALALVAGIFSLPLEQPEGGWRRNPTFYAMLGLLAALGIESLRWQRTFYVSRRLSSDWRLKTALPILYGFMHTGMHMLVSSWTWFPLPFGIPIALALTGPLMVMILGFTLKRLEANSKHLAIQARVSQDRQLLMRNNTSSSTEATHSLIYKYKKIIVFNCSLLLIYPIYMVGFRYLHGYAQFVYISLLLVLKSLLIGVARVCFAHVQDMVAASTAFTVELFNSAYSAMCMSGAQSSKTVSVVIMTIDALHMWFAVRQLIYKTYQLDVLLNRQIGKQTSFENVVEWSVSFAQGNAQKLRREPQIRMDPSNGVEFKRNALASRVFRWFHGIENAQNGVLHEHKAIAKRPGSHTTNGVLENLSAEAQQNVFKSQVELLHETLAFMYMIEYVVLVEYIESVIPLIFAAYSTVTFYGPNKQYNLDLESMDDAKFGDSVANIMFYATLEWASLVFFFVLIKWKYKMNVLHHLGFVLETHFFDVQGKMCFFLPQIVTARFFHFGVDFTFQFDWIHQQRNQTVVGS